MIKLFKKIRNYYFYYLKLSSKLVISYWLLLLIPTIAVSIFIYKQIYTIVIADTIRSEQALSMQTVNTIEATLRQIHNASNLIKADSYLQNLFADENTELSPYILDSSQTASFFKSVESSIDGSIIKTIKIYADEPFELLYNYEKNNTFQPMQKAKGSYWNGIFAGKQIDSLYCPTFYLAPSEITAYGDMSYVQRITYGNAPEKTAAFIVVYYQQASIADTLQKDISISDSATYIVNERNNTVTSSNISLSGTYFMDYSTLTSSIPQPETFVTRYVVDKRVYTSYYPIAGTDWLLVSVIPAAPLLQRGMNFIMQFVAFYLAFLAVAFIVAITLSRSMTRRISSVSKQMESVRSGKLLPMEVHDGQDEIYYLIDTYNYMTNRINALMEAQAKSAEQLRTSEFNALQAQINPHFLYNTLDMINWLSQSGHSQEVTGAVQALSKFYKLTLSKKDTLNTIEQELAHVSLYVRLQNMRYKDKIHFLIDVPDEIMENEIPKLTFQPIVENAIQHGILEKESKEGSIVLTAWIEEDAIIFLISDDGVGMDSDVLQTIVSGSGYNKRDAMYKHGSNIGIYNTHERLKLLYGDNYGLSYESSPAKGTDVTVRIPAISS